VDSSFTPSVRLPTSATSNFHSQANHKIATAAILIAFVLSFSDHTTTTLLASLPSFIAATLTLSAFAVDIALFLYLKNQSQNLGLASDTRPGVGLSSSSLLLSAPN
jgi:hypothetical protein